MTFTSFYDLIFGCSRVDTEHSSKTSPRIILKVQPLTAPEPSGALRGGARASGAADQQTPASLPCTNTCRPSHLRTALLQAFRQHKHTHSTGLNVPAETPTEIIRGFPQALSGAVCLPASASLTPISGVRLALASEHPYNLLS